MSYLEPRHHTEWQASCVAPEIIAANVRSIEGQEVIERLAGDKLAGFGGHSAQYATGAVRNVLQRYENSSQGGWWVSGLDPLNNWVPMEWGQFKADTPDRDHTGKLKKYTSPEGQKPRALFLAVSWRVGLKIAKRHGYGKEYQQRIRDAFAETFQTSKEGSTDGNRSMGAGWGAPGDNIPAGQPIALSAYRSSDDGQPPEGDSLYPRPRGFGSHRSGTRSEGCRRIVRLLAAVKARDDGFWAWWLSIPSAPVVITEGGKKGGCGLSQGYATVALVGVNAGYRVKDALGHSIQPELVADIKAIATPGRPIYLAFDQDIKATARRRVVGALLRFGGLLQAAGCIVRIVEWSADQGKGLDDLVANAGPDALHHAIDQALTLEEWRLKLALDNPLGSMVPAMRVNTSTLDTIDTDAIPETGIVAFKSAKGTGKTGLMADLVDSGLELALGHRIALMRNLCQRLRINYRGDLSRLNGEFIDDEGYTLRVGGCVDGTLMAIDPDKFRGCNLILDEFVQVMRHLLTSSTCNKDGARPVLLARFTQLVQSARRIIVADADLAKPYLDYLAALRGDNAPIWLLVNDAKPTPWPITFIESPDASAITARLIADVAAGQRVLVVTDSKAGSKRLDWLISEVETAGMGRHLLLNSDTSGGETERLVITDPNNTITDYQVVIATPSMATGVSIEVEHFDQVYGLFWGASSTDADMSQALARVRKPVPRVVWCAKYGRSFSKVGRDTNPLRLKKLLQDKANATAQLTAASLGALGDEVSRYDWLNPHVDLWARIEADRNRSMLSLRSALKVRLIHEGHNVTIERLDADRDAKQQLAAVRLQIKEAEARATAGAANLTATQAKALEMAEHLEADERLALAKWHLAEFYAIQPDQVTPELVLLDNDGRYRGQLLELEAFIHPETASAAVVRSVERQAQHHLGICPWDVSTSELRRQIRVRLGLGQWLDREGEWDTHDDALAQFATNALALAPQVKAALNVALKPDMSPQQMLGQLLDQMGLATESRQVRQGKQRTRIYQIDQDSKAQALAILARRAERRQPMEDKPSEPVTPPPVNVQLPGGCDTQEPPYTVDSRVGRSVRWGASLGVWVVLSTEGSMATIQLQNPVVQTVRTVPLADLNPLDVAA